MRIWALAALAVLTGCGHSDAPQRKGRVAAADAGVWTAVSVDAAVAPAPPPIAPSEALGPHVDHPAEVPDTAPARKPWIDRIDDAATFDAYSKEIGAERFAKFVIDLESDAIYYFDVNIYPVHKDFVFQELYKKPKTKEAVRAFDKNYSAEKPAFLLCYLVHHLGPDVWTFAFWDGDRMTDAHVKRAYERMKATFFLGGKVKFRPDSNYQESVARGIPDAVVPSILNSAIYTQSPYQAFNLGAAVGTLRVVPAGAREEDLTLGTDEIVVLHTPLADITPVAGIISDVFSTPLAHVSLRARDWGIPNVGAKEATVKLAKLDGKVVVFVARATDYDVHEATPAEIAVHDAEVRAARTVVLPAANLEVAEMATLEHMRATDVGVYGTKASALGEIVAAKVPGIAVPAGFGVPFHWYREHLRAAGIDKKLVAMLADPAFAADAAGRKAKLAAVRAAIVAAPVSPELRAAVDAALGELTAHDAKVGVFVRSSTNAEDLAGFTGAGDYDTVPNAKGTDAVLAAIKRVWASVWNSGAYEDRARYGIDEASVAGAVLVQIGVDATAAGVLVTANYADPRDERNYTINAKSGLGMAVVDGRAVPESLLVSWYNHGVRVLSRSAEDTKLVFDAAGGIREVRNDAHGKPVLTTARAVALADAAHRLTHVFRSARLDIEWVFAGPTLYIVQARPLPALPGTESKLSSLGSSVPK